MKTSFLRIQRIWLPSIFGRLCFLFFLSALLVFYTYLIGNFQGFTDTTLLFLLNVQTLFFGMALITGVFTSFIYILVVPFTHKKKINRIIRYSLISMFSLVFFLGVTFLQVFMKSYGH